MNNQGHLRKTSNQDGETVEDDNDSQNEKTKKLLFTGEKYQDHDPKALRRNADQWRMKERV